MRYGLILIGLFFLLPGMLLVGGSWIGYYTGKALMWQSGTTTATIVKKTYVYAADGDSDYEIRYTFTPPASLPVTTNYIVGKEYWESHKEGDTITVHYGRAKPSHNFPDGYGSASISLPIYFTLFGGAFAAFGAVLLYGGLFPERPERRKNST